MQGRYTSRLKKLERNRFGCSVMLDGRPITSYSDEELESLVLDGTKELVAEFGVEDAVGLWSGALMQISGLTTAEAVAMAKRDIATAVGPASVPPHH